MARTDRQEEHIREKYPDLERRREQERQAKIDSIILLNKYGDVDAKAPSSFRAGSFHDLSEVPKPTPSRRRSSAHMPTSPSPAATPLLKGKASAADLMFEMDEEDEDGAQTPISSSKKKLAAADVSPQPSSSNASKSWGDLAKNAQPFGSIDEPISATPPRVPGRPWGAAPLASDKLDMKEIMQQTAGRQTSSLSAGLAAAPPSLPKAGVPSSFTGKMSQKERKRQQQVQLGAKSETVSNAMAASPAATPSSPWQTVGAKPAAVSRTSSGQATPTQPILSGPKAPQMTMRQTIANPGTPGKDKSAWPVQTLTSPSSTPATPPATQPAPRPSSSKANATPRKASSTLPPSDSPGFAISDRPVAVQSVRHVPKPERSVSIDQRNMIDILSEQEIQKQEIRDFGSKRSLMDIQQEQEFQEWWDKESARVREEEAAAATSKSKGRSGGGARGGRRRGRGGGNAGAAEANERAGGERKEMANRRRGRGHKADAGGSKVAAPPASLGHPSATKP